VKSNVAFGDNIPESNTLPESSPPTAPEVAVCIWLSSFVQVTDSPTFTSAGLGTYALSPSVAEFGCIVMLAPWADTKAGPIDKPATSTENTVNTTAIFVVDIRVAVKDIE
jgi:hypothetical protein